MKKVILKKFFIFKNYGKRISFFDINKSELYTFNETATEIIKLIRKGFNISKINQFMAKKYSISLLKAKKDSDEFIKKICKSKIAKLS